MRFQVAVAISMLLFAEVSLADVNFSSASYFYELKFPDGWSCISDEDLKTAQTAVGNSNLIYEAAFQLAGKPVFSFPYVMVQVIPYRSPMQPSLAELKNELAETNGDNPTSGLSQRAQKLVSNTAHSDVEFNDAKLSYTFTLTEELEGRGSVRTTCVGFYGKRCIVQIGFNCSPQEYEAYRPVFDAIASSFNFSPSVAFDPAVASQSGHSIWDGVVEKAIGGGITVLILGGVVELRRRFAKKQMANESRGQQIK